MADLQDFEKFGKKKEVIQERKKEVWCYTRVSSKEQENNFSLQNQKEYAEKYAKEHGLILVRYYGGTYESGKDDFTRKEFVNLINEVRKSKNKPYAILVYNMTRFSRSGGKSIAILNELIDRQNVHLIETLSGISTENPRSRNELNQRLLEAEGDNIRKLEVSVPGMQKFLENGCWMGRAPIGYTHFGPKTTDHTRYSHRQRIEINEDGIKLKQAWQWKLEGVQDIEIARRLKLLGIIIDSKRLSDMWKNVFYCGLITNTLLDGKVIEGNHEPLVSRDVFLKVNQINTRRTKGYKVKKENEDRPLTGDLSCYLCGNKLTSYYVKKKGLHYYKCQKCKGVTINAITKKQSPDRIGAHEMFVNLLNSYKIEEKYLGLIKEQLHRMVSLTTSSCKKEETLFKKRLTELEKDREQLEERFAFGKIPETLYKRMLTKIDTEIYELKEKHHVPEIDTSNFKNSLNKSIDLIQNISEYWTNGCLDIKKRIQRLVFPGGILYNPENRQYLTPEVNKLFLLTSELSRVSEDVKKNSPLI
jgi:DNA invertase Pin-like site-specific DNA recombinase